MNKFRIKDEFIDINYSATVTIAGLLIMANENDLNGKVKRIVTPRIVAYYLLEKKPTKELVNTIGYGLEKLSETNNSIEKYVDEHYLVNYQEIYTNAEDTTEVTEKQIRNIFLFRTSTDKPMLLHYFLIMTRLLFKDSPFPIVTTLGDQAEKISMSKANIGLCNKVMIDLQMFQAVPVMAEDSKNDDGIVYFSSKWTEEGIEEFLSSRGLTVQPGHNKFGDSTFLDGYILIKKNAKSTDYEFIFNQKYIIDVRVPDDPTKRSTFKFFKNNAERTSLGENVSEYFSNSNEIYDFMVNYVDEYCGTYDQRLRGDEYKHWRGDKENALEEDLFLIK